MPHIILKKTFKIKPAGFQFNNEKSFSLHGSVSTTVIQGINNQLRLINFTNKAQPVAFKMDTVGHYSFEMNHEIQKYHEEDIIVAIFDKMEILGYSFKFQYDTELSSQKVNGSSYTRREMFIFQKQPDATDS
jgi:hypothetical protein